MSDGIVKFGRLRARLDLDEREHPRAERHDVEFSARAGPVACDDSPSSPNEVTRGEGLSKVSTFGHTLDRCRNTCHSATRRCVKSRATLCQSSTHSGIDLGTTQKTPASFGGCKPSSDGVAEIAVATSSSEARRHRRAFEFSLVIRHSSYFCANPYRVN